MESEAALSAFSEAILAEAAAFYAFVSVALALSSLIFASPVAFLRAESPGFASDAFLARLYTECQKDDFDIQPRKSPQVATSESFCLYSFSSQTRF